MKKDIVKKESEKKESGFQRLRKNLKGLTFEQKIDHIFQYYWGTILLVILVPVVLGFLIAPMFRHKPDVVFSGNCCNVTLTEQGQSYLINDWNRLLNMEPGALELRLNFTATDGQNVDYEFDEGFQVVAAVAADDLDYVLCDSVAMDYFAPMRAFQPLDTVLDAQALKQWEDRIYYFTDSETGTSYAAALDISNLPFVQACVPEDEPVFFMFANKSEPNVERLRQFFSFLCDWGEEQLS